jgi:transcriptional regulator with XRE-family HTH domain
MAIGDRLKFARERAGLSIGQAAKLSGIPREVIEQYEKYTTPSHISADHKESLSDIYGIRVSWIQGSRVSFYEQFILDNATWIMEAAVRNGKFDEFADLTGMFRESE